MFKFTSSGSSDVGRKRPVNEDSLAARDDVGLYVVCDGMGGHARGDVASRLAVDELQAYVEEHQGAHPDDLPYAIRPELSASEALLWSAVLHANDRVFIESLKNPALDGMGTTLAAMLVDGDRLVLSHVGDSRIYRWRPGQPLDALTRDHSLLNQKIDTGEIRTLSEISKFKHDNVIVRAIGLKDAVEPDVLTVPSRPGEIYLLCSDGLTDMVDDYAIASALHGSRDDLGAAARQLVGLANEHGGKDNITVLLVEVSEHLVDLDDEAMRFDDTLPTIPVLLAMDDGMDGEPDVVEDEAQPSPDPTMPDGDTLGATVTLQRGALDITAPSAPKPDPSPAFTEDLLDHLASTVQLQGGPELDLDTTVQLDDDL